MSDAPSEQFHQAATAHANLGYPVFQCIPNGKQPLNTGWQRDATTDELGIDCAWDQCPTANVGIPTDGLLILDIDADKATGEPNPWLSDDPAKRESLYRGPIVRTGGGGHHIYFQQPIGRQYRNTAGRVVTTLPWRIVDYRAMVREPDLDDFMVTPRRKD